MPVHLSDSLIYRNSWGTDETRAIFDDEPRTRAWLEILAALAEAQAEVGLIPAEAARDVARACRTLSHVLSDPERQSKGEGEAEGSASSALSAFKRTPDR